MSKVAEMVFEKIKPIIDSLNIELVEVEYAKKNDGMNLTVFIVKPAGITIDDCERVSRAIDAPIEELNPTNDTPYRLNVSSLGLRPFKTTRDYERNLNCEISVKLYALVNGSKEFTGVLKGVTESHIELAIQDKIIKLERNKIAAATPNIKI